MSLNTPHYFVTWSKQIGALKLPLDGMDQFHFKSGDKKWLDLSSISYQASFGHKNQVILKAMKKQMTDFPLASPKHVFDLKNTVSKRLLEKISKSPQYKCFYTQSGSEGIENALKMVRQITNRPLILSLKNSYHGATMGSLSITGDWRHEKHLLPNQWRKYLPDPQKDPNGEQLQKFFQKINPDKVAAVCLETITGGNGVYTPSKEWWKKLKELLKANDIKLILDEVVCAGHRTGPFFGFQNFSNLKPDFIVTAKAMTGGYFPLGVLFVKNELAKFYDDHVLSCGLTNYAHPIGLAACKAVLDITSSASFLEIKDKNELILKGFLENELDPKKIMGGRSFGLLAAIDLLPNSLNQQSFLDAQLYVAIQNNKIILAPPLNMSPRLLKSGLKKLGKIINEH